MENSAPSVLCLDFDGTLVDADGSIHPRDREVISSSRESHPDIMYIPATGRNADSVRRAFERNGLFCDQPMPFPMILLNGALLYLPGERLFRTDGFEPDVCSELIRIGLQFPDITSCFFRENDVVIIHPSPIGETLTRRFDLVSEPYSAQDQDHRFTKLICMCEEPEEIEAYTEAVAGLPLEMCHSLPTALEINQQGVTKGSGLEKVLQELDCTPRLVAAAGDGDNDLSLFDIADLTFCPAGSPAGIRNTVDHVIETETTGLLEPVLRLMNEATAVTKR
jgi:5-amino-6-(5-phospho-D-ribitylamino)uracil phosphatase